MEKYDFIKQSPAADLMIEGSLYRCRKEGIKSDVSKLPAVSEADILRCKGHVSGHIHLMRNSSPDYYQQLTEVLSANKSVLLYLYENFDVFGRYGNQELKDELARINLKLGSNLSEEIVGTNAAVMCSRSPNGVWVIGDEHYIDALKPYACYSFQIHGKYGREGQIMLITRASNLTPELCSLFKFIESTECIVTAGLVSEDIIIKDTMFRNEYSKQETDNIALIVDTNGIITYANDVYYDVFKRSPMYTINKTLVGLHPELAIALECIQTGKKLKGVRVTLRDVVGTNCFLLDCIPINAKQKCMGLLITANKYRPELDKDNVLPNHARYTFDDILGVSDNMVHLKMFAERISATPSHVLIQGESGTGKELFVHAIHNASNRKGKPFVAINCAAIPKELIGSELFGYVGGSFTGANKSGAKGKFEQADGGTLFLDEIGEMPVEMQSVLLRVIEDGTITKIGGTKPTPVDVRIITATNRDLPQYIAEGKFRADLYYRLNVINVNMVPLRKRREDIPVIAEDMVKKFSAKNRSHICGISGEAMQALIEYRWPGNVRELRNEIERASAICDGDYIETKHLSPHILNINTDAAPAQPEKKTENFSSVFSRQRKELLNKLMQQYNGNKSKVAEEMGISRSTLYRILNQDAKK